jgi:SAM-dependent methyltransferase
MTSFIKVVSYLFFVVTLSLALALGYLRQNPEFRHRWFASVCTCLVSNQPEQHAIRCDLLKDVRGDVLELGPGPATNMECFEGKTSITSYTGIEPNIFLHEVFRNKTAHLSLPFPLELKTLEGEHSGLPDEKFDTVVFTHVLCSVHNATQVLAEVDRVLKPGGRVFFLEHIASPPGSWMRFFQKTIEPIWSIALDGCKFPDTHLLLERFKNQGKEGFEVMYHFFDAPMPLAIVKPHLMGHAVKKGREAGEQ